MHWFSDSISFLRHRNESNPEGPGFIEKTAAGSARALKEKGVKRSPVCLVLGSGFQGVASKLSSTVTIPYGQIPGMPTPNTEGHAGLLHSGRMGGRDIIVFEGRKHYYEGGSPEEVVFPVFLAKALGAKCIVHTCSAGAVSPRLEAGDLLLVEDHVNLSFRSPLAELGARGFGRFVDMFEAYDESVKMAFKKAAVEEGVSLESGTLAQVSGPSYETFSEVVAMDKWGVDAVTMSTVPGVIMSRYLGVKAACVALITNSHRMKGKGVTTHSEVLRAASQGCERLTDVLERVFGGLHF